MALLLKKSSYIISYGKMQFKDYMLQYFTSFYNGGKIHASTIKLV